jgi:hypothetical protein
MTSGTAQNLIGVWGSSASDVFATGVGGVILRYDGSTWSPMRSGTSETLFDVWGGSASDAFAVGSAGTIVPLRGTLPPPYGGICTAPIPLYCSDSFDPYYGYNGTGRTADFDSYGCPSGRATTGNEVFYRLDCPVTGEVTVRLTPVTADLDLIILAEDVADPERGCDPTECIAASQTSGIAVEEVTFTSAKGVRYYAVVDGHEGAVSGYMLEILCAKL